MMRRRTIHCVESWARLPAPLPILLVSVALVLLAGCDRTDPATSEPPLSGDPAVVVVATEEIADPATNGDTVADPGPDMTEEEPSAEVDENEPLVQSQAEVVETPVTAAPEAQSEAAQGRVVLWHSYTGADADALSTILADLQRTNPGLTVETLFVAYDDLPQSYADAVLVGGGPDLVAMPTWWLTDMVAAGIVQPLDGLVESTVVEGSFPATVDNLRRDGVLYGLPMTYELVSLFVNTSLVDEASLPATTDDMLALAQDRPEAGAGIYANLYHLAWGLQAYGADLLDGEGTVVLDQGAGAADFLAWLDAMNQTEGTFVDLDYGMLLDRFKKGEFAFFMDGPWAIDELRAALGNNLDITRLPAGPVASAKPWLSAEAVLLNPNKTPDQQQRALLVARALTDANAGATWAEMARRLPANQNVPPLSDPLLQGFAAQAMSADSIPHAPEMDEVWGYAGDMISKSLNGVMSADEAVIEATALINEANGR